MESLNTSHKVMMQYTINSCRCRSVVWRAPWVIHYCVVQTFGGRNHRQIYTLQLLLCNISTNSFHIVQNSGRENFSDMYAIHQYYTQPNSIFSKADKQWNLLIITENKDACIIHTLSYSPKWCFIIWTDLENQDTLIIRTLVISPRVSTIHSWFHCMLNT